MAVLDHDAITEALTSIPHWTRAGDSIRREVRAPSFLAGIELVGAVARAAEAADHHPDIDIRWRTVTFTLTTHSEGGITAKDVALAGKIDQEVNAVVARAGEPE